MIEDGKLGTVYVGGQFWGTCLLVLFWNGIHSISALAERLYVVDDISEQSFVYWGQRGGIVVRLLGTTRRNCCSFVGDKCGEIV